MKTKMIDKHLLTFLDNGNIRIDKQCGCSYIVDINQMVVFTLGECKTHETQ